MSRTDDKAPVSGRLFCFFSRSFLSVVSGRTARRGTGSPGIGTCPIVAIVAVFLAGAVFPGCSSAEPEILQSEVRINAVYDPRNSSITEELQIQADLFDPDGIEDIDQIRVLHEGDQLFWVAAGEETRRHQRRGEEWFAFTASAVPGSTAVPRGEFRIESVDLSGREAVRQVAVPLTTDRSGPEDFALFQDGTILLPSGVDELWIIIHRAPGEASFYAVTIEDETTTSIAARDLPLPEGETLSGDTEVWFLIEESRYLVRTSGPW
jgi:hypothetical protein